MDVKKEPVDPHVIKTEPHFVSNQIEENNSQFRMQETFENNHDDTVFDGKQEIVECEIPKIEQPLELPTKIDPDSVCENIQMSPTFVKKEIGNTSEFSGEVKVGGMFVDIKHELSDPVDIHLKAESELLNTHCDLPTLKNEIDDPDCCEQPCNENIFEDVSKKKRQYPCFVCLKNSNSSNASNENTPMGEESITVNNSNLTKAVIDNSDKISSSNKVYSYLRKMEYSNSQKKDEYDFPDNDMYRLSPCKSEYVSSNNSHSSEAAINWYDIDHENVASLPSSVSNDEENSISEVNSFAETKKTLSNTMKPATDKNIFCMFCFEKVSHFPRHLVRKHQEEQSVQKIMALPVKGSERKAAISALRKKGSFILMEQNNDLKPVRLPNTKYKINDIDKIHEKMETDRINTDNYFPCVHCLGFYSKSYLWRHKKNCKSRINESLKSRYHLAESQTFLVSTGMLGNFLNKSRLKKEVFNIMKPDKISEVVKKDGLICLFGDTQLNKHKRVNMNLTVSNKMREFARFKMALQNIISFVHLIDVLKPENYNNIITSVKIISGYDADLKKFKAASLALHLGPGLQYLCRIAKKAIISENPIFGKKDDDERKEQCKEIEALCDMIKSNWCNDVTGLANKVLNENENKNEKPGIIPLTSDVKLFNEYVTSLARESVRNLKSREDITNNYRTLVECALALILIFNGKKIEEVQFLEIKNYEEDSYHLHQEECLYSLTDLEKAMSLNFKKVVVFKGSKAVPILFTKQMQSFVDELLIIRKTTDIVPNINKYIFANPESDRWVNGFSALRKLANKCGAKNPKLLTSIRFRNQVATILQLINFEKNEIEQIAQFMGHTEETYLEFYCLPKDTYQTAKVAKVLLLMNAGKGETFKGKKLRDIKLSDNEVFYDVDLKDPAIEADIETKNREIQFSDMPSSSLEATKLFSRKKESIGPVQKSRRFPWTKEQKSTVLRYFNGYIKKRKLPKKDDCLKFIDQNLDRFQNISWSRIKILVYNTYRVMS